MTIRIGLIGAGTMGADHARTIVGEIGGAELAAVHDTDVDRARQVAEICGGIRLSDSADQLIADPTIDAVLVASPDHTHTALAIACIKAGKPALVEKPIASTLDECRSVIAAEIKGGRRLIQVGFMRRFDPGYLTMKDILARNLLGPPLFLHCVHRNALGPDYLTSELVITNSAVHEIDIARYLFDEEFAAVSVTSPRPSSRAPGRQPQLIVLETRGGIVVDIEAFVDATYGYEVRAELVCEAGAVTLAASPVAITRKDGHEIYPIEPDWRERFKTAYREQIVAWMNSIRNGKPGGSSAWDGYAAATTATACVKAWRSRQRIEFTIANTPGFYR
jgi:myo-inositol 2-dehydrogenase/D-chiro-inositol 1-dehydrogenase